MGSSKNVIKSWHGIIDGSMATSLESAPTNVLFVDNINCQLNYTGTPTGTFTVQVSSDYDPNTATAGNWIPVDFGQVIGAAGSGDQIILDMNQLPAPWMKVVYTSVSGTGTLNMYLTAKEVG